MTRVSKWELVLYVTYLAILYMILTEPDSNQRRLSRLQFEIRTYRRIAEFFGKQVIAAEMEYADAVHS